jgi:hypothetical protein
MCQRYIYISTVFQFYIYSWISNTIKCAAWLSSKPLPFCVTLSIISSFVIPFYSQSVPVHSANCIKTYTVACSTSLYLMGSKPLVAFGKKTYKLNLKNWKYRYNNYTRKLVGRSFGRCLHNRLLSGKSMRFTNRSFGRALRRALYWEV